MNIASPGIGISRARNSALRAFVLLAALTGFLAIAPAAADWPGADPRPVFHFAPARGWMNDPNGLVYLDGEYHMFFQYNPYGDRWGHMSWGHAVSRDLIHWRELSVAIPETEVMAFSGSAVVDRANTSGLGQNGVPPLIALYTGYDPRTKNQSQYLAYSLDHGRTFTRFGKVLDIGSTEFRDPKVFWHEATHRWIMVVVRAAENRVAFYTSPDLRRWTAAGTFGPAGARGPNWECPDLFELPVENGQPGETRWVLSVNLGDGAAAGGSGGQWFVGSFDGTRFTLDPGWSGQPHWMDGGADFYAAVSWNGVPDGRRLWIGWANNWRYANAIPTWPSRGLMSIPRQLSLRREGADWALAQAPVDELDRQHGRTTQYVNLAVGDAPVPLPAIGESVDATIAIDPGTADEIAWSLTDAHGWQTRIGYTPATRELWIDRTRSGPPFHDGFADRHAVVLPPEPGLVTFRLLVDRSVVEVFADRGARTITDRFFRGGGPFVWSVVAHGGPASVRRMTVAALTPTP